MTFRIIALLFCLPFCTTAQSFSFKNGSELTLNTGLSILDGDVTSDWNRSYFVDLKCSKPLNEILSTQLVLNYNSLKGISTTPLYNLEQIEPLIFNEYSGAHYISYKSTIISLNTNFSLELSNLIIDHTNKWNVYIIGGIGITNHQVYLDNFTENEDNYTIHEIITSDPTFYNSNLSRGRREIKKLINSTYDFEFETPGPKEFGKFRLGDETNINPNLSFGIGIKRRFSKRLMLGLEMNALLINSDLLDGIANQSLSNNTSFDRIFNIGISISTPISKKLPKTWNNHLSDLQQQNDSLKHILEEQILATKDTDKDGVIDKYDNNNNTPKDCPVDKNGDLLDSDKDGIADCFDKFPYWNDKEMTEFLSLFDNKNTSIDSSIIKDIEQKLLELEQYILNTQNSTKPNKNLCYIFFDEDSSIVSKEELKKLLSFIAKNGIINSDSKVTLYGSSSIKGESQYNNKLAESRIFEVKSILEDFFLIPSNIIFTENNGEGSITANTYQFLDQLVIIELKN